MARTSATANPRKVIGATPSQQLRRKIQAEEVSNERFRRITNRVIGKSEFHLSWPEDDFEDIVHTINKHGYCIYGQGRQVDTTYCISKRQVNGNETKASSPYLTVPSYYGEPLEHLCYLIHYFRLAWGWIVDSNKGETLVWKPGYNIVADSMARSLGYHLDALKRVVDEVRECQNKTGTLPERIKTLDEWIVRWKFGLEDADVDKLLEAKEKGYFTKDFLMNADHFGVLLFA